MRFTVGTPAAPQTVEIDWNSRARIGILLSGGLDSAVLLAAMLHVSRETGTPLKIQPFTIKKPDNSFQYVDAILGSMKTHYGVKVPAPIFVGDGTLSHAVINRDATRDIFSRDLCDFLFFGLNQNPPETLPGGSAPNRPSDMGNPLLKAPLLPLYKNHILELAIQLKREYLFLLTHTCTERETGRCGACWQCEERAWAFRQVGIADPGMR